MSITDRSDTQPCSGRAATMSTMGKKIKNFRSQVILELARNGFEHRAHNEFGCYFQDNTCVL